MLELLVAAATAATPITSLPVRRVDAAGVRATYTRAVDADGTIHLVGTYEDGQPFGGTRFHYRVKGDKVFGHIDGVAHNFARPLRR